ncbi:protein Shroom1 isoform X2 [Hyperolius riggenbachi]|uniref:protein Shroom1 isoform X2 n=1 Tax=Hyperolius riggenbachi TaxID=752182 RepID=UPI0035A29515
MSTLGSAIEEWSTKSTSGISDLRHQLISGDLADRLSPVKAMAAIVDSAYSSFSGSSYVPDYQPSFKHGVCQLNDEQISYMDSEYVKAIYSPTTVEHKHLQQHLYCEDFTENTISGSGDYCSYKTKRSPTSSSSLCSPDHKISRHSSQGHSPLWVMDSVQGNLTQSYALTDDADGKVHPYFVSSVLQAHSEDMITVDEARSICDEKHLISHTNKSNIECSPETEVCAAKQHSVTIEEQALNNHFNSSADVHLKDSKNKSSRRSWNEFVSEKFRVYRKKAGSWKPAKETNSYNSNYEGTKSESIEELAHNQQNKEEYQQLTQNKKDTEYGNLEKWDTKYKRPHIRTIQSLYFARSDDMTEQMSKAPNHNDPYDIPTVNSSLRKDATIKPIPLLSQQQETSSPYSCSLSELTSEKITKASTPMLYHLAAGSGSTLVMLNSSNQSYQTDTSKESDTFQKKGNFPVSQVAEPQKPLHKTKSHSQLNEKLLHEFAEGDTRGSLTSSTEESFMLDYREKLKIAQKKVLRETSFKRKDLQMSLPIRLKLNPSKRPSIDHIRSYSLSNTQEEPTFVQPKTSLDNGYTKEEQERTVVLRRGGRKRLTKEQRKLCYSEPEKLDHLGVYTSGFSCQNEGSCQNKSGHYRMKSLDKERTFSSSNISKTELKQIQHNALVEYMERKTNQRPSSVYQTHTQKTSGVQSPPEWKSILNEISGSDIFPAYHKRSTGASSSYDASWSDRPLKMSMVGEYAHSTDKIGSKTTYADQGTLENNKIYSKESTTSGCQKRFKTPARQMAFSTSALHIDDMTSANRLSITVDNAASEAEKDCAARSRGKSMEELGTSDKIRLSVLSQSSDQLYHIKGSRLTAQPETASSTAVLHQDKLKASADNESGREPRQTSTEDFLVPHGSDAAKSAQERHSRSPRASTTSSHRHSHSSPSTSQSPSKAAELSLRLQAEDEVFSQPFYRAVNASKSNLMHQKNNRPHTAEENPPCHKVLPAHVYPDHQAVNTHMLSLAPSEEDLPECDNEVRAYMGDLWESSAIREPPVLSAGYQEVEAVRDHIKSPYFPSMTNVQKEELNPDPVSQVITTQTACSSAEEPSHTDEAIRQNMEATTDSEDSATELLAGVTVKASAEERCAELVKEIIAKDKSLGHILKPLPVRESAVSLMQSLFNVNISVLDKNRDCRPKTDRVNTEGMSKSHSKTMLLLRRVSGECLDEITSKKLELISNLNSQLEEFFTQRELLLLEISENAVQGRDLEDVVKEVCKPNEYERYMMFIGDLEKVVSLLFCLTTRLARVEYFLSKTDENTDAEEMQSLKERHTLLSRQREDAKDLKDNLDRREQVVTGILAKYLTENQLEDYKHYVRLKTSYLIEQKDLDEKIKFHEEQLESLHNSIPP